jgi:hypothetical protein
MKRCLRGRRVEAILPVSEYPREATRRFSGRRRSGGSPRHVQSLSEHALASNISCAGRPRRDSDVGELAGRRVEAAEDEGPWLVQVLSDPRCVSFGRVDPRHSRERREYPPLVSSLVACMEPRPLRAFNDWATKPHGTERAARRPALAVNWRGFGPEVIGAECDLDATSTGWMAVNHREQRRHDLPRVARESALESCRKEPE